MVQRNQSNHENLNRFLHRIENKAITHPVKTFQWNLSRIVAIFLLLLIKQIIKEKFSVAEIRPFQRLARCAVSEAT